MNTHGIEARNLQKSTLARGNTSMDGCMPVNTIRSVADDIPRNISIEATSVCNLTCKMCVLTQKRSSTSGNRQYLSSDLWSRLQGQLHHAVDVVLFAGFGEPTLHPGFVGMLGDLNSLGIASSFTTNGVRLTDDFLKQISTLSTLGSVHVSIDSADPSVYADVRGGKVNKVLDNIGRYCASERSYEVAVAAIAMRSTAGSLASLPGKLHALGVHSLVVQSLYDQSEGGISETLGLANAAKMAIDDLRLEAEKVGLPLTFENPDRMTSDLDATSTDIYDGSGTRNCSLPWHGLHIDAAGTVFPCCRAAGENQVALGDTNLESLSDIWNGPAYHQFRRDFTDPERCPDVCARCSGFPRGVPVAAKYAAELVPELCYVDAQAFVVAFRNTGLEGWTGSVRPTIGTAAPLNRLSKARHPNWMTSNRPAHADQVDVAPGEVATYRVLMDWRNVQSLEHFQLVIDGSHWLPNTVFSVARPFAADSGAN